MKLGRAPATNAIDRSLLMKGWGALQPSHSRLSHPIQEVGRGKDRNPSKSLERKKVLPVARDDDVRFARNRARQNLGVVRIRRKCDAVRIAFDQSAKRTHLFRKPADIRFAPAELPAHHLLHLGKDLFRRQNLDDPGAGQRKDLFAVASDQQRRNEHVRIEENPHFRRIS